MAAPKFTTWPLDKHTQAKHEILQRYLGGWLPILIYQCNCARIVDGFAGPGIYENGEVGSPLIALQMLLTHSDPHVQKTIRQGKTELIFIEKDSKRSQCLQGLFEQQKIQLSCPPQLQTQFITGTFLTEIDKLLTKMEKQRKIGNTIPTFFFIDPFGFSHTPLNILTRIQPLLFETPDYTQLQSLLTTRFKGQEVNIDEIEEYVMTETPYIAFKREGLAPLESASPPKILVCCIDPTYKRQRKAFLEDKVSIRFL